MRRTNPIQLGRGAVYRKFGICRICFRNMARHGLIPGVQKQLVRSLWELNATAIESYWV